MTDDELRSLSHPNESVAFDVAVLVVTPVVAVALLIVAQTMPAILLILAGAAASIWFSLQIAQSYLIANALRVSPLNFPEIYALLQESKRVLGYHKKVDIYIVSEGTINAFLSRFFATKFIVLNSELVDDMVEKDTLPQIQWVIARFVGALRAKHDKLFFLRVLVSGIESVKIFNLFLLPYERAVQYSGDQIGLAVCMNLEQPMLVLQKLLVGNTLSGRVSREGVLEQKQSMGLPVVVTGWFSTHPHTIDRYINLLQFAERRYPEMYKRYINSHS